MNSIYRDFGFTLIEVLVAVAIFALVSTAVQKTISQNLQLSHDLENKTIASWIAQNRLNQVKLVVDSAEEGRQSGRKQTTVEMASRSWRVTTEFEKTNNKNISRVDIDVALMHEGIDGHESFYSLSGFVRSE